MLSYAILFFLIAIIAGFLGFGGVIGGTAASIAEAIFLLSLVLFVVSLLRGRRPRI